MVDCRLPDGSRVNAIIPPLAIDGASLTIRKFARDPYTVQDLISFGTLSAEAAGANPLGYHTGSVWPHDTAIAVRGLAGEGHGEVAARLARGLLTAAPSFGYRLPELFAGTDASRGEPVLAYPAACRPQSWSAAASVALVQAALGLRVDVPAGELRVRPDPAFADWFPMRVTGLHVAGHDLAVTVDAGGVAEVATDAPLRALVSG